MKNKEPKTIELAPSWFTALQICAEAYRHSSNPKHIEAMRRAGAMLDAFGPMLDALSKIHANAAESPEWIRNVTSPAIEAAAKAGATPGV